MRKRALFKVFYLLNPENFIGRINCMKFYLKNVKKLIQRSEKMLFGGWRKP